MRMKEWMSPISWPPSHGEVAEATDAKASALSDATAPTRPRPCSLLRSVLCQQQEETSTHKKSQYQSSLDGSVTTLWNESDEEETNEAEEGDAFPLTNETTASTLSLDGCSRVSDTTASSRTSTLETSLARSVSKGESHISSRLDQYGIVNQSKTQAPATQIHTAPLHVQMAVEEVHRWLFVEGGHFEDVQALMTHYSNYIREEFSIPLDRLYYGGIGLHPKLTAYLWRWEPGDFELREMPEEIFSKRNELFSPDEPFCLFDQGRAEFVRIRDTDVYIPPDTEKWFRSGGYTDYFALPDIQAGRSTGGMAWSTKCPKGFREDDIHFFRLTHSALTTIMRLHTNDLVLKTLTERMEKEIEDRTTELAAANLKLEQANKQISVQSAKQLEHFASMSHEIRTPLNCILGLSSLLVDCDDMSDCQKDFIKMIHGSADLLSGVVNDVLDYTKLESGHFEIDIQPVDLQSAFDTVVHSIATKSKEKDIKIRTSYSGLLPRIIHTDSRRLQQILYNLLGNATKFSGAKSCVDFCVGIQPDASGNTLLQLSVKDYGKGIDQDDFESIFRPFSQASKETQTIYGGTGLGLSITRKLVQMLGGTISVKSELGKYAEFVVRLPYNGETVDLVSFREKFSNTTIFILDEAERILNTYSMEDEFMTLPRRICEEAGLHIKRCSTWSELEGKLDVHRSARKHAFLVQQHLLPASGIDQVNGIMGSSNCYWFTAGPTHKTRGNFSKNFSGILPSILLETIFKTISGTRRSLEKNTLGAILQPTSANGVLRPPCSSLEMISPTSQLKKKTPHPTSRPNVETSLRPTDRPFNDSLKVLYAEDNVVNQKVLDRVLRRLGVTDVTIVDNGLKAVDLCETTKFDIIFLDMQMPVMDGLEACKRIVGRKSDENVVFVTAHALEDVKEKARAAGASDFVSKPFNLQKIESILGSTMDKQK